MTPKKKPANLRPDVAETAFRVMQEATGERPKTRPPAAVPTKKAPSKRDAGKKL